MKFLISVSSIFVLFSCSKEVSFEKDILDYTQVNSICKELFSNFVVVENNSLVLSVDDQSLVDNGFDAEILNLFKENMSKANTCINNYMVETKSGIDEINIELADDIEEQTYYDIEIQMPGGMLDTTNGDAVAEDYFFAPFSMTGVNCNIISAAPAAFHIVITHAQADCSNMRVGMGSLYVQLLASNCYATIKYLTTDSNGGKCAWRGVASNNVEN